MPSCLLRRYVESLVFFSISDQRRGNKIMCWSPTSKNLRNPVYAWGGGARTPNHISPPRRVPKLYNVGGALHRYFLKRLEKVHSFPGLRKLSSTVVFLYIQAIEHCSLSLYSRHRARNSPCTHWPCSSAFSLYTLAMYLGILHVHTGHEAR